jgi:hypothetical protein
MTEAGEQPRLRRRSGHVEADPRRPRPRLAAETDVLQRRGAAQPPTLAQCTALAVGLAAPVIALVLWPGVAGQGLHHLFFVLFSVAALTRLAAALTPLNLTMEAPVPNADLPAYTVIAPLYREAEVVPDLLQALEAIDYPRERLQVLVVIEADDAETRRALAGLTLPRHVEVLVAPPGHPRTKPRACNIALERATGDQVTIYDAEDRPHPGQLREAAARFAAGSPRLACLQAPLRIDHDRRFLPRQFAIEYAIQFETILPGLARLGLPFPLGGTSNHFRMSALRAVGGWDAWNVTEDADLGFRLAAEGYELGVLTLPTLEAAPDRLADWLPQRARWVKGYMQTFGVQTRTPPHWRTGVMLAFALTLGVAILAALAHGPLLAWSLMSLAAHLGPGEGWLQPADLTLLAAGWLCTMAAAAVGMRRAGAELRLQDLLAMPLYWPLLSLAAAHALWQLVRCPHHWDKTWHAARTGQVAV